MRTQAGMPAGSALEAAARRRETVLRRAREEGLVGEDKDARISGRVRRVLIDAAKSRTGLGSDTELVEYALAKVALEDDFGRQLLRRKGSVPRDVALGV